MSWYIVPIYNTSRIGILIATHVFEFDEFNNVSNVITERVNIALSFFLFIFVFIWTSTTPNHPACSGGI